MFRKITAIGFCVLFLAILIVPYTAYAYETLSWDATEGEVVGYRIYYGTTQGTHPESKNVGKVLQYSLSRLPLSENATYYLIVRAYNDSVESGNSNEVSFTVPDTTPPSTPSNISYNEQTANLEWRTNTKPDLKEYRIYSGTSSRNYPSFVSAGKNTSFSTSDFEAGTKYYFTVTAVDNAGNESGYSNEIQAVIVSVPSPKDTITLDHIGIEGPLEVDEKTAFDYNCRAYYSDGTSQIIEASSWNENSSFATISSSGLITISDVVSTGPCRITASYTEGEITKSTNYNIEIQDIAVSTIIIDNKDKSTSRSGFWAYSKGLSSYNHSSLASMSPGSTFTYAAPVDGSYNIYLWWTEWSRRCLNVPVDIYDGQKLLDTVEVNHLEDGGKWNMIGKYVFSSGTARVVIRAESKKCSTCADAVKFVKSVHQTITPTVAYNPDDTTPPTIRRIKPTSWRYHFTRRNAIYLSGKAADPSGVDKVEWTNSATNLSGVAIGKENWKVLGVKLKSGWNEIIITATDEKGNEAVNKLNVICWSF